MKLISSLLSSIFIFAALAHGSAPVFKNAKPEWPENFTYVWGEVSGEWDSTGSPFIACSTLVVAVDDTLIIHPGVRLEWCLGGSPFEIHGTLIAVGTLDDSITFTSDTTDLTDRWQGLRFLGGSDDSRLEYCLIENAYYPFDVSFDAGGGVRIQNCSLTISHCWFRNNRSADNGGGLEGVNTNTIVSYCRFTNNHAVHGGGAVFSNNSNPLIDHCIFEYNSANQGGGVGLWWTGATIRNCTFAYNHGDDAGAVRCDGVSLSIRNCILYGSTGNPGMGCGIRFYQTQTIPDISHNCFWDNPAVVRGDGLTPPDIGVNVQLNANGDSCDAYFNLMMDPQFVAPENSNYALQDNSPCIDAGDHFSPRDPDSSVTDMGAIPNLNHAWNIIDFEGGFTMLGCPCEYPLGLVEGSLVRLRRDETGNGISDDDPVLSEFTVSAGAGLPPWNGCWEPVDGGGFPRDSFYVDILAGACCWVSAPLEISMGRDTAFVSAANWQCGECDPSGGVNSRTANKQPAKHRAESSAYPASDAMVISPNPFNAVTSIRFELAQAERIVALAFDIQGRQVAALANGSFAAGTQQLVFDGTNLATGIYFVRLQAGATVQTSKLLLLK